MLLNMAAEQQGNLSVIQHFIIGSVCVCTCDTGPVSKMPIICMNDHAVLWLAALRHRCWWCFAVPYSERGADKGLSPPADSLVTSPPLFSHEIRERVQLRETWASLCFIEAGEGPATPLSHKVRKYAHWKRVQYSFVGSILLLHLKQN